MDLFEKYSVIIQEVCNNIEPGKKMLQKLMYLIERKGMELDLNYSIHFFGPYSATLDNALHILEGREIIDINTSGSTHKISMKNGDEPIGKLTESDKEILNFVIENFSDKSALELEAITTLDYVATVLLKNTGADEDIIENVIKIKGKKFTKDLLKMELDMLKKLEYLS